MEFRFMETMLNAIFESTLEYSKFAPWRRFGNMAFMTLHLRPDPSDKKKSLWEYWLARSTSTQEIPTGQQTQNKSSSH